MAVFDLNQPASSLSEEDDVAASNSHVVPVSSSNNTGCDSFASHDDNASLIFDICYSSEFMTPPGGSVIGVPRVSASVLPVLGTVYDSLDECIRGVYIVIRFQKQYTLTTFDVEHNHELDRVEYKHLSKAERKLTYNEQLFIIKAANANNIVSRIYDDTDFKDKFGKIVWNMFIGPEEFEDRWNKLMEEFNLVNHKWLSKMYRLRSSWVPAFFVDSPLCGLMRTTSRSESENSFFSYFTSSGSTLVKFMLCYESAMERQRHTQEKLDHQSFDSFPALLTPLPIEQHAAKVYTRSLFIRVQKEIVAGSWLCSITCMSSDEGCTVCIIDEEKIKPVGLPEVIDKESTSENVEEEINLHQKVTGHYKEQKNRYGEKNEAIEKLAMEASVILDSFYDFIQEFMGVKKPDKVKVKNPTSVMPKGREKQKRMKNGREISMKKSMRKSNKKKNGCGVYGSTDHNRRTYPQKNDVDVLYPAVVIPGGSDHVDGRLRDGASGSVSV
ncbi:FAR1-related sequence 5-like protein [Tanacetum coccineum]